MATGDELLPLDKKPVPGKIYDSNGVMICARLRELGAEADLHPIKGDAPGELAAATERLLQEYPLVITTGGVSVGDRDYMPAVAEMVRARILFHGIAAKPGSPALAAVRNGRILLALSGNPFACIATLELLARAGSGEAFRRERLEAEAGESAVGGKLWQAVSGPSFHTSPADRRTGVGSGKRGTPREV